MQFGYERYFILVVERTKDHNGWPYIMQSDRRSGLHGIALVSFTIVVKTQCTSDNNFI